MPALGNVVLALILGQSYTNVPYARRRFSAHPWEALLLIFIKYITGYASGLLSPDCPIP
jgi:hypothetical protein